MANVKKMTKRDYFKALLAIPTVAENEAYVEFINHEIDLLDKKNSADRKPSAKQTANDSIKVAILDYMEVGKKYTISEIMKLVPECADLTNQRVSALIRQLKDDELVIRTEDKRKAYFHKP